jgi:hypothetical protein
MRTMIPCLLVALSALAVSGAELIVAPSGGDYTSIQDALDNAGPGDTVTVRAGTYVERLYPPSGSAGGGFLTLRAYPGEDVYVSGNNSHSTADPHLLYLEDASYVRIIGLAFCSNLANNADGGSGIFIEGGGSHIHVISNRFFHLRGTHAMGITVYGTASTPVSDLVVAWNTISNCQPATSEALTLNGNVRDFVVASNVVADVNNIGIDFIGGETDIHPTLGARQGVCSDNRVMRANSSYGGGFAAGIYVDGGRSIVIERNAVTECDMGIEIGAEHSGWDTTGIVVRSNLVYGNDKIGLVFGGYDSGVGRVRACTFVNNTIHTNNGAGLAGGDFHGEIVLQYATGNDLRNNLVVVDAGGDRRALSEAAAAGNSGNVFNYNLYYCAAGAPQFQWGGGSYTGFNAYTNATGTEMQSLYAAPELLDPGAADFGLTDVSPAIDRGDPASGAEVGASAFDGTPRILRGTVDIGAFEYVPEPTAVIPVFAGLLALCRR